MADGELTPEKRRLYSATVLLNHMVGQRKDFDVLLLGGEAHLEPLLTWLLTRQLVEISEKNFYTPTVSGRRAVEEFNQRYQRLLQYFEVFSAVDLEAGEFAYASFADFESDHDWDCFLEDERWDDLRLVVADYLGADPVELIWAQFTKEGRFNFTEAGWEITLAQGLIWNEIAEIAESAWDIEELGYGEVSGEAVLRDIVEQGFLLVRDLTDRDPDVMAHLARWAPSRQAPVWPPDDSREAFWKTRWQLALTP
ncbi:hypothetical protein [Roseibacillus ishigakijimensis]|uniref:Uncharacterized protein n=1 Tax=Roseibacillus ishigakijimensis TaxID=454146 RepID=A0A934RRG4_9BACT|nr:hypothetical protein [Roseibacillus ishigakijimensis]MBK1835600.1 hypothetical protein [Roseibacillus ishigakijimensis]